MDTTASDGSPPAHTYIWCAGRAAKSTSRAWCGSITSATRPLARRRGSSRPAYPRPRPRDPALLPPGFLPGHWHPLGLLICCPRTPSPTRRLSHLASYQGMGTAAVECVSGCRCKRNILDGTWERDASLFTIMRFHVGACCLALSVCVHVCFLER